MLLINEFNREREFILKILFYIKNINRTVSVAQIYKLISKTLLQFKLKWKNFHLIHSVTNEIDCLDGNEKDTLAE